MRLSNRSYGGPTSRGSRPLPCVVSESTRSLLLIPMYCLQIAHRINTIMDSDRVLVMSDGKVSEYDTPEKLMENPVSASFCALW